MIHCWYHWYWDRYHWHCRIFFNYKLEYFTEFYLFQAWTWQLTMSQIYVTLWGRWCVCVCVRLLRTFITFSTHQNPSDKHIAYFNQNWLILRIWHGQLVLPLGQVENSSTCPTGQVGKKSYCHTLHPHCSLNWSWPNQREKQIHKLPSRQHRHGGKARFQVNECLPAAWTYPLCWLHVIPAGLSIQ